MSRPSKKVIANLLESTLINEGFIRRGCLYYRIFGDDLLQTIDVTTPYPYRTIKINVGIFPVYRLFREDWQPFAEYDENDGVGYWTIEDILKIKVHCDDNSMFRNCSDYRTVIDSELRHLRSYIIPILNDIRSARQCLDFYRENGAESLELCLKTGEYETAKRMMEEDISRIKAIVQFGEQIARKYKDTGEKKKTILTHNYTLLEERTRLYQTLTLGTEEIERCLNECRAYGYSIINSLSVET